MADDSGGQGRPRARILCAGAGVCYVCLEGASKAPLLGGMCTCQTMLLHGECQLDQLRSGYWTCSVCKEPYTNVRESILVEIPVPLL